MPLIKPFAALCPAPGLARDVAAPPYDVMSAAEARRMVVGRPWSFLHVSRAEVDLAESIDPYSPLVYAKARENLDRMLAAGILVRDPTPGYQLYRLTMGEHRQTGLVAAASLDAYAEERIKRHELTRPVKEDDRVRQIDALNAQTGPVLLACRTDPEIECLLARLTVGPPATDIVADGGVRHELWPVSEPAVIAELTAAFDRLDALYIADGHHRCAAAARIAEQRRAANPEHTGQESYNYALSVIFPQHQMRILAYHRLVKDLHGHSVASLVERLAIAFEIEGGLGPVTPERPGEFGMYLGGHWYRLTLDPARSPYDDPVGRLDASLLQSNLIGPILGIQDPRRDERIDFVGGIRGLESLAARVDSGEMAVAFALYPTRMDDLLAVADAGEVMPPKSTWFEPKLADGLVSQVLA
jgi:uncharacterized protein (DUF1015 family)